MKPSLYERKTRGGVSYRAYAQMLSQTILGTECSLFHFQKTSDLLWQRQIGKRQKKERKKEGIKKKSPMQTVMPYWSGNDTSSADFILFLRRKTCSVKAVVPLTPPLLTEDTGEVSHFWLWCLMSYQPLSVRIQLCFLFPQLWTVYTETALTAW